MCKTRGLRWGVLLSGISALSAGCSRPDFGAAANNNNPGGGPGVTPVGAGGAAPGAGPGPGGITPGGAGAGAVTPMPGGGNTTTPVPPGMPVTPPVIDTTDGAAPAECASYAVPRVTVLPDFATNPQAIQLTDSLSQEQQIRLMSGDDACGGGPNGGDPSEMYSQERCFSQEAIPEANIEQYNYADGPRGVRRQGPPATAFPVAVARAASFDITLEERVGGIIGEEMLAFQQDLMLAPTINLLRHPRWGRAQETYGEDPTLLGEMGAAFIRGIQQFVPTCVKHFAANNTENNRLTVSAQMDMQTLRENYTRHFEVAIEKSDPACVMAAYNAVNGTFSAEHSLLLTSILRDELAWKGFVLSDWWATVSSAPSVLAGLDLEMPGNDNFQNLPNELQGPDGARLAARIVEATQRRFNVRAHWNQLGARAPLNEGIVDDPRHIALPQEVAEKGMVLLENDGILPLQPSQRILLASPDGNVMQTDGTNNIAVDGTIGRLGDNGSSEVDAPLRHLITPLNGLQSYVAQAGQGGVVDAATDLAAAVAAAPNYDVVILLVSMTHADEGEGFNTGGDRENLHLGFHPELWTDKPRTWIEQLSAATAANPNLVVVLNVGSAVVEPSLDLARALVYSFYPGQAGGTALARLLYGAVNFSGKLPFTIATDEAHYPLFENAGTTATYDYLHGYRKFDAESLVPKYYFGSGISYTAYEYANLRVPCTNGVSSQGLLIAEVDVTNTGAAAGTEIVQLYIGYPNTQARRPPKELKAFTRVDLAPGETKTVQLSVPARDMRYYGPNGWTLEATAHQVLVGPSADPARLLSASFMITQ